MEAGHHLAEGTIVGGDFSIVRPLGSGGMGAVYVAAQRSTNKLRALKVMHRDVAPDEEMRRRFEQEARVGARIKSDHIVEVVAAGHDASLGLSYLVMELLDGVDLMTHLRQRGALPLLEVVRIFEQLCHGMAAAHAASIVHRDLKPENIFLAQSHQAGRVAPLIKILDFGIAKFVSEQNTHATSAIGSPMWMAPEQTEPGPVTPAADVWALGLIAYTLLTGQFFWKAARTTTGTPMYLLREIVVEPIPPASERGGALIPPGFDAWFGRCVARDPRARFADAAGAWRGLQELAVGRHPSSFGPEAMAATSLADGVGVAGAHATEPLPELAPPQPTAPLAANASSAHVARTAGIWPKISVGLAILVALLVGRSFSTKAPSSVTPPRESVASRDPDDDDEELAPSKNYVKNVRDHHVRLFPRLAKNGTNVTNEVLVQAVDWIWYNYLDCYAKAFGPLEHLRDGTVIVSFELDDMLPRHAKLVSSTFDNPDPGQCVVNYLTGITINAAGAKGAGHVEYEFKFQAN